MPTFIDDLDPATPVGGDSIGTADNEIRALKQALQDQFSNLSKEVSASAGEINFLRSATSNLQQQVNELKTGKADLSATADFDVSPEVPTPAASTSDSKVPNTAWVQEEVSAHYAAKNWWEDCGVFDLSAGNNMSIVFDWSASAIVHEYMLENVNLSGSSELGIVLYSETGSSVIELNTSTLKPGAGFNNASGTNVLNLSYGGSGKTMSGLVRVIYNRDASSAAAIEANMSGAIDGPIASWGRVRFGFGSGDSEQVKTLAFYAPASFNNGKIRKRRRKLS